MSRPWLPVVVVAAMMGGVLYVALMPPAESPRPAVQRSVATAAAERSELQRRKQVKAVQFLRASDRNDEKAGHLLEGAVANRASFPVYEVQVCIQRACRPTSPPTLAPGAEGTFSVPLEPDQSSGSASVVWRVERPKE